LVIRLFLLNVRDLKLAYLHQNMPKPKSPERPLKRKVEPKVVKTSVSKNVRPHKTAPKSATRAPTPAAVPYDDVEQEQLCVDIESVKLDDDVPTERISVLDQRSPTSAHPSGTYPALIRELLSICMSDASDVRGAFKNRNRQKYKNIFDNYKDKLSQRDYSIIKGSLFYLYDFSRVNSIDKDTALWMLGIYEIPSSQIISYTSKEVLKSIAKDHGLSYSNKKAEDLVESIRGVIDPSQ
jgi:hypothetical protein